MEEIRVFPERVSNWFGEVNVAETLSSHRGSRYLDAAPVANHILVLLTPIFAASALKVVDRTENRLVIQCAALLFPGGTGYSRRLELTERTRMDFLSCGRPIARRDAWR